MLKCLSEEPFRSPHLPSRMADREFLRPIIGGGGTQLVAARALAPELQGRSLYCLRPPYRIRAGKA